MKICFLARPIYDKVSTSIYKYLRDNIDNTIQAVFVTTTKEETDFIRSNFPESEVYETSSYISSCWSGLSVDQLKEYELQYDCSPIWSYIYTDRYLINREYEYTVKMTIALFSFFENLFDNIDVDYYYSETIATLLCYVAYIVGKKKKVQYICQMSARGFDSTHHYFVCDPYQMNLNLEENWKATKYTNEEYEQANKFLHDFETKDIRPSYMIKNGAVPRLKPSYSLLPLLRFYKGFSKKYNDPFSYIYFQQQKIITNPIKFYFRYQIAKRYYKDADYSQKYVYFPLHFQPEASTIVCAQKYEKQLFFIDSWAKSLPADTKLYVKEHYAILGHRDLQFYKELRKYPNVVLIDPYEDPRKMIINAYAVTTLTGTAGWEAMLLRKPVFLGGNIFFENAPGVVKVQDIYQNYLDLMDNWIMPTREQILQYLCAYIRSIHKGNIYRIYTEATPDADNLKNVCESLYQQISRMKIE